MLALPGRLLAAVGGGEREREEERERKERKERGDQCAIV